MEIVELTCRKCIELGYGDGKWKPRKPNPPTCPKGHRRWWEELEERERKKYVKAKGRKKK